MFQIRQRPTLTRSTRDPSDGIIHRQAKISPPEAQFEQQRDAKDQFLPVSEAPNIQMQFDVDAPQISMKCANCDKDEMVQMQAMEDKEEEKLQMQPIEEKEGMAINTQFKGEAAEQKKPDQATIEPMIQKEDEEDNANISPDAPSSVPGICSLNPVFPDFNCFLVHLKRNIDTNLYNNAHHFMRIARLYPDDSQMMEDAFMRYGLGVNILETSYQFLGAGAGLATGLAYGTGVGLKALDFITKGELMLDFQINLADDVNLDLQLDLNANPDNLTDIRGASAGVGVSGHF